MYLIGLRFRSMGNQIMDGFQGRSLSEDRTATFVYAATQPHQVIRVCVCVSQHLWVHRFWLES